MDQPTISIPRTWARPSLDLRFCAVEQLTHGAVRTTCQGSWSTSDTVEVANDPPIADRCGACMRGAIDCTDEVFATEDATIEIGPRPTVLMDFDMSDADEEWK